MSKVIPVDLEKYPSLVRLVQQEGQKKFQELMHSLFRIADNAVERGDIEVSKKYFKLPYHIVIREILDAFFDIKGIMEQHGERYAHDLANIYGHAIHPLHAAITGERLNDREGNNVTFREKYGIGEEEFTIKHWLQGLLFYSYYMSLGDLARYLSLNKLVMAEEEKKKRLERLIKIQPALNFQAENGIPIAAMIPGTGFFDLAVAAENVNEICPACKNKQIDDLGDLKACRFCNGGFRRRDRDGRD